MSLDQEHKDHALDLLLPRGCMVSLHAGNRELNGQGYKRQRVTYDPSKDGQKGNSNTVTFDDLPKTKGINSIGIWHPDGTMIWDLPIEEATDTVDGVAITLPPGHILHILK